MLARLGSQKLEKSLYLLRFNVCFTCLMATITFSTGLTTCLKILSTHKIVVCSIKVECTCNSAHAHQHYEDLQKQLDLPRHTDTCTFVLAGVDLWCHSPWRQHRVHRVTHIPAEAPLLPSHVEAHSAVTERSVLQLPPPLITQALHVNQQTSI